MEPRQPEASSTGVALLGAATASLLGFVVLAAIALRQQMFALDHTTRALVHPLRHSWLDGPMAAVSLLGNGVGLIPLILLGSLLLWRVQPRWALGLPVVMLGTGALQLFAKWAVHRPRPNLEPWGFPSGHVLSLVVLLGLLSYLLCASGARWRWRWLGGGLSGATLFAVAWSRLHLEAHWVSDLAGGFALGLGYLLLVIWVVESLARRRTAAVATVAAVSAALTEVATSRGTGDGAMGRA
ncbi:MAG: phosphatase PAP2 family protein [Candidatus Rokubacteria bacterium]|nr:phosphatase PAP2 family protein [Candidatus Rokubacteria bacterium]